MSMIQRQRDDESSDNSHFLIDVKFTRMENIWAPQCEHLELSSGGFREGSSAHFGIGCF